MGFRQAEASADRQLKNRIRPSVAKKADKKEFFSKFWQRIILQGGIKKTLRR
jgi:hypothetical protein